MARLQKQLKKGFEILFIKKEKTKNNVSHKLHLYSYVGMTKTLPTILFLAYCSILSANSDVV